MKLNREVFSESKANLSLKRNKDKPIIVQLCQALGNDLRLELVKQIRLEPQTIIELAKRNFVSISTMVFHINILENAGIINVEYIKGAHGPIRKCFPNLELANINLMVSEKKKTNEKITFSVGVGQFVDCSQEDFDCTFCTKEKEYHVAWGNVYMRERLDAVLLTATSGYVVYHLRNDFAKRNNLKEISISLEICSEAYYYDNNWESDITFWLNDKELLTYTSPGDFGDRRGVLNPDWWSDNNTQYGELKTIKITENGIYLDNVLVNSLLKLSDLHLSESNRISFKIGNKPNAEHVGGFNIFGDGFGDYKQDILVTAIIDD